MTVVMFWNTGKTATGETIGQLCQENDVDLLLLAETETPSARLTTEINGATASTRTIWELPRLESRVRAFTRYAPGLVKPVFDDAHVKMLHLTPPIGFPLLIVAAHLPSKLWAEDEDQSYRVRRLRQDIVEAEGRVGHQNTMIIGDLNANPFEDALMAADGLHGMMDKAVVERGPRSVQRQAWDYFYNPMWSRLGDESRGRPGTYWRSGSGVVSHFWHTFDQVLLRPGLLHCYDTERLVVPDRVGEHAILGLGRSGAGLSDHLPVVIGLDIEKELRRRPKTTASYR